MENRALFISGIDTDAGKTYATAFLARRMMDEGLTVATQKFIQTGCRDTSEDIEAHRRLAGCAPLPEDAEGITAPIIFSYPASAQLAAAIDGREIDLGLVDASTALLLERYDRVLVEGAGGLMVPIRDDLFAIDYIESRRLPLVLVTNGRLGSINHTILSLEAVKARGIELKAVVYNRYFDKDSVIAADTHGFIERYISRHFPDCELIDIPVLN
ncbi:ATP-dependent dethiobiotin synthetase BioD 1 [Muribaculaceae bacterium]|nr:ATP-dependent dethiobiotin synthetase BioD 1 [Muribaculaceae bacterium]